MCFPEGNDKPEDTGNFFEIGLTVHKRDLEQLAAGDVLEHVEPSEARAAPSHLRSHLVWRR